MGLRRAAQVPLVVGAGQPRDEAVRRNPVGALREHRPAVDDKLERLAPAVGVPVERDRAQADAARPPVHDRSVRPDELDREVVKRLGALAVGPPERGIFDFGFLIFDSRDHLPRERDRAAEEQRVIGPSEFRGECQEDAAGGPVLLRHAHALEAVAGPTLEADIAPDPGGDQPRAPVPPELALLFPDDRAAADRVVDVARPVPGPVRPDVRHRAVKKDCQLVPALAKEPGDVPPVAEEHVLRAADLPAVEADRRDRVESVRHEFHHLVPAQRRGKRERGAVLPVAVRDPLHVQLVRAPEWVWDQPVPEQVAMHAARHLRLAPAGALRGVAKVPACLGQGVPYHASVVTSGHLLPGTGGLRWAAPL